LLDLCAELERPRPKTKTPLEFIPVAFKLFSSLLAELETITQAYIRVRYGELPETEEEVENVEQAWRRIAEQAGS
jgi:hypothetical protein